MKAFARNAGNDTPSLTRKASENPVKKQAGGLSSDFWMVAMFMLSPHRSWSYPAYTIA